MTLLAHFSSNMPWWDVLWATTAIVIEKKSSRK